MVDHFLNIKTVLSYIENRVTEELCAEDVAAATGFSVPHFRAVFRDSTGQTLARYINRRRLSHAAFALAHSSKSVSDIAMDLGFGSHDAFTRAFRREIGCTPSLFRQDKSRVSGTLIVPGLFGPSVSKKEEISVDDIAVEKERETILYGVPKVTYFSDQHECTPFISSLKACLNYMGQTESYAMLMAASGAAFRLMWNPKFWDGGNVDILCVRPDATELLIRALNAAGRDFTMLCKPGKAGLSIAERARDKNRINSGGKEDFISLIKSEIDSGRPVIGFGIVGPPEACIITGYRDEGEVLLGWSFFQDMPEFAGGISNLPCGYFCRRDWFEHPDTIAVMALGEQKPAPDAKALLKDTLQFALEVMENPTVNDHAGGQAAFDAWAAALGNEGEFPPGAPLPMLMERLMCQVDAANMVSEGRWNAHLFLEEQADKFPDVAAVLRTLSLLFKEEAGITFMTVKQLEVMGMEEKHALNLAKPDVRATLIKTILKARDMEKRAAEQIRKLLMSL